MCVCLYLSVCHEIESMSVSGHCMSTLVTEQEADMRCLQQSLYVCVCVLVWGSKESKVKADKSQQSKTGLFFPPKAQIYRQFGAWTHVAFLCSSVTTETSFAVNMIMSAHLIQYFKKTKCSNIWENLVLYPGKTDRFIFNAGKNLLI